MEAVWRYAESLVVNDFILGPLVETARTGARLRCAPRRHRTHTRVLLADRAHDVRGRAAVARRALHLL
jgi:hypothetical protein